MTEAAESLETLRRELQAIYDDLETDLAAAGPRCLLSGRCCRFTDYDHTLFLSEAEAAVLLADAPAPPRPLDQGHTCPWQDHDGRCSARQARPLACRVYFCDPAFQEQMPHIAEHYHRRLKRLVDRLGLPWNYAPLHQHLHAAAAAGRFPPRMADPACITPPTPPEEPPGTAQAT